MKIKILTTLFICAFINSCASIPGNTGEEQKKSVDLLVEQTLADLYHQNPKTKEYIAKSIGYAVMKGQAAKYPVIGTGSGYGVAIHNTTNDKTYLEITEFSVGAGLGVRTIRFVIIFEDEDKFNIFKKGIWKPRTSMEAAAKSKEGGTATGTDNKKNTGKKGYAVYFITDSGASATATLNIFHAQPIKLKE
jgi:lipid-binding SYLF domain-containing protein